MIYLASRSPRRRELLDQLGVEFRVLEADVDESRADGETPQTYVRRLAEAKAATAASSLPATDATPVLGADTIVIVGDELLGKPRDESHALDMLERLSGRCHSVLTAVALATRADLRVRLSETLVWFRITTEAERAAYVATGEPLDKAGAYAIQGRAAAFISHIDGSYSGVVGLPLYETAELLVECIKRDA